MAKIQPKPHRIIRGPFTDNERQERERLLAELEKEKPDIIAEGRRVRAAKQAADATLRDALSVLKEERAKQGVTLGEMERRTGMAKAALSRLENDKDPNPIVLTLERYAEALGKTLIVSVAPAK